jgi:small subunit ribosomal protein S9
VTEHPENDQPREEEEGVVEEPAAAEEPPAAAAAEEPAAAAPEEPAAAAADEPAAEEPAAAAADEPAAEEPAAAAADEPAVAPAAARPEIEEVEEELTPRVKPEIPGADLVPDLVPEGQEFLDAEARAAAEADAEAAALREAEQPEDTALPIADAAIDLAAGARYTATGKRKTAVARVILKPGTGTYSINGKPLDVFFPRETLQRIIRQPLETVGYESRMDVVARMHGGGVAAQAGALRHGISRALIVADPNLRGELKRRGFLTRDPRVKERKKAGLKKARKRPQFSKR